jgi:hypothetical protein
VGICAAKFNMKLKQMKIALNGLCDTHHNTSPHQGLSIIQIRPNNNKYSYKNNQAAYFGKNYLHKRLNFR